MVKFDLRGLNLYHSLSNMMKHCSICGDTNHNKRTCPNKPIEDSYRIESNESNESNESSDSMEYEEEIVTLPPKRDRLIHLLKERQEYAIHPTLFKLWMIPYRQPCPLQELRYVIDQGFTNESIELYLELCQQVEELF